ncbi:MAG: sulfurtransferase TusA family protein [Aquificaceae bacterium]|nr:sulfurtransferase TusA family protein [Aquificaceae bacterium]MDW8237154.1 sulfurtransferase TusA family protein [Aquificaceae bacterium]
MKKTLDLSGLMCPLPIVMTSEKLRHMNEGEVLQVISTDPGFDRDVHSWCAQSGNELLEIKKENGKIIATIKKSPNSKNSSLIYWIKFHALGVKLHVRQVLIAINPFIKKPDHFITFSAISDGLKAEKLLGGKYKLLPIPNAIDPHCGVVLAVRGKSKAQEVFENLSKSGINVEAIYEKTGKTYRRVFPA